MRLTAAAACADRNCNRNRNAIPQDFKDQSGIITNTTLILGKDDRAGAPTPVGTDDNRTEAKIEDAIADQMMENLFGDQSSSDDDEKERRTRLKRLKKTTRGSTSGEAAATSAAATSATAISGPAWDKIRVRSYRLVFFTFFTFFYMLVSRPDSVRFL